MNKSSLIHIVYYSAIIMYLYLYIRRCLLFLLIATTDILVYYRHCNNVCAVRTLCTFMQYIYSSFREVLLL